MSGNRNYKSAKSVHDFMVRDIKGKDVSLEKYKGHVLLIVNVASLCGLSTVNFKELNILHDTYAESKGLRILAFPSNEFGSGEPGTSMDIRVRDYYKQAEFDVFEKIHVNGEDGHPLYKYLKKEQEGTLGNFIKWNFTKFIVDKDGKVVERHGPNTDPSELAETLEKYF